jgi:trimethylamine--corrinoid protein Co-methyltransferase
MLEMGMTLSYGQLVIDDEIAAMVKRVVYGSSVDDELMGVDLIKKVGIGGNFLTQRHSLKHLATEKVRATISDRRMRGAWEKRGSKTLIQSANERARELLNTHKPLPLPEGVKEEFKRIIKSAEE